jgi:protein required for attachment to host cells
VFLSRGPNQPLALVQEFEHPQARARGVDLLTDAPRMEPGTLPRDAEAAVFAHQLEGFLEQAAGKQYDRLILVCPPGFLGMLRKELSKQVASRVVEEVAKDLTGFRARDLEEHLGIL